MEPDVVAIRDPERQLHPLPDFVLEQKRIVHPDRSRRGHRAAGADELGPGDARPREVERAGQRSRARAHDPLADVADVDELDAALGRAGNEDVAASREAVRPVREPSGRIVWTDDETRASDEGSVAYLLTHRPLAQRLEGAVVRVVG